MQTLLPLFDTMSNALPLVAAFDVGTFLKNATSTAQGWGGLALTLVGTVGIVVIGIMMLVKFFSNSLQQWGWGKLVIGLLISGAIAAGGFAFLNSIASGGKKTIEDLGNGTGADALMNLAQLVTLF